MRDHAKCALENPDAYEGTVTKAGTHESLGQTWSVIEAANYFDLPPLLETFRDWAICEDGIYSLYIEYFIPKERYGEAGWINHVTEKPWVRKAQFIYILTRAKEMVADKKQAKKTPRNTRGKKIK
jgi:hypothetical protein